MIIHFIIKNFGKVQSADITLNNLIVFVGNNNSGKTLIMQLIYGIRKELESFSVPITGAKKSDLNGQYLIRCDHVWFKEVESEINNYLANNQSRIINDIFGISISAEEIKILLENNESEYFVSSISEYRQKIESEQADGLHIDTRQYVNGENIKSFENQSSYEDYSDNVIAEALKIVWKIIWSGMSTSDFEQLFLPASRSGLQLLYRHYFAGKTEGNLVMPVKDFLRFLQLYSESRPLDKSKQALLAFAQKYLLHGDIVQQGDETFYVEAQSGRMIPLYIASSMIHELTPFIKCLNGTQQINWLYCDEVENSMHPLLQREMARWFIRMANAGMHVIISSHSDTMASRLNNLFMLSHMDKSKADYEFLTKLNLSDADLLRPDIKADVYEFRNEKQKKTIVKKLEFISYPMMGYDFQLFSKNLDKLYDEADIITR